MKIRTFSLFAIASALASSPLVAFGQTMACPSGQNQVGTATFTMNLGVNVSGTESNELNVTGDGRTDVLITTSGVECTDSAGIESFYATARLTGSGEITDKSVDPATTTKFAGMCVFNDAWNNGTGNCSGHFSGPGSDYDLAFGFTLDFSTHNACIDNTDSISVLKSQCAPALRDAFQTHLAAAAPDFAGSAFGKAIAWGLANEHVRLRKGY